MLLLQDRDRNTKPPFCECSISQTFLNQVQKKFKLNSELSPINVLLNTANVNPKVIDNLVILVAKHQICKAKCASTKLNITAFKNYLFTIQQMEKFNALKNENIKIHQQKWQEIDMYL